MATRVTLRSDGPPATAPTRAQVRHGLILRVIAPVLVLWAVVVATGWLITGPLDLEDGALNRELAAARTPTLDAVTAVFSGMATTEVVIASGALAVALLWWRTRQWWFAAVPAIALIAQTFVFLTASVIVGRERPDVERLDPAPPTSGFPSGHTGAASALCFVLALCATRIERPWLRIPVQVVLVLLPFAVALARVYRGMHYPSDVFAGLAVGLACAVIGWRWLR